MRQPMTNIMDLREMARRRVPHAFFEYADGGSFDEVTLRSNRSCFEAIRLKQRVMLDVDLRSTATTVLGQSISLPLAIAPTGLAGLQRGSGEILGARAAVADLTVQGQRHREIKSGLSVPPRITLRTMFDMSRRPRWVWNVLNAPSRSLGNLHGHRAPRCSIHLPKHSRIPRAELGQVRPKLW